MREIAFQGEIPRGSYTSIFWAKEVSSVLVGVLYKKASMDVLYRDVVSEAG
jgi:hypothetical protein